jgi:hypothetical protein
MLHNQRGVARFTGYVEPPLAPGNDCVSRAPGTYALTVTPSGSGAVTSNPAGIDCGATCRASFDAGTSVTLSANPAPGSSFTGWGGACSGVGSCVLSMTVAKSVTAGFQAFSLIDHYYSNILKRAPDAGGKAFWQNEVTRMSGLGVSPTETHIAMAGSFYISPEFLARGLTDDQFIQSLYLTFLSRSADQSGLDYWRGLFAAGVPRDMVMYGFVFSAEFKSFMVQNLGSTSQRPEVGAVIDYYRGILGRLPENDGIKYWVNQFRTAQCSGNPTADVYAAATSIAAQFFGSPEYTGGSPAPRDYVADLYNAFMRRIAEPGGYNYWINQITSGAQTRDQARQAFIDSPEFAARVQAITAASCIGLMQ